MESSVYINIREIIHMKFLTFVLLLFQIITYHYDDDI